MEDKIYSTKDWLEFSEQHLTLSKHKSSIFPKLNFTFILRSPAVFDDGTRISIQQSSSHYCNESTVELGFPTFEVPDYLLEYAEDPSDPNGTVYPYVPFEVVDRLIKDKGGINVRKSIELYQKLKQEIQE